MEYVLLVLIWKLGLLYVRESQWHSLYLSILLLILCHIGYCLGTRLSKSNSETIARLLKIIE